MSDRKNESLMSGYRVLDLTDDDIADMLVEGVITTDTDAPAGL